MIYLIIGRRERGKTTLAYWMASRVERRAVLDPRGMIRRAGEGVEYAQSSDDARDSIEGIGLGEVVESIYRPTEDDLQLAFDSWTGALKRQVMARPTMEVAILVDEASFFNLESPTFQWLAKCSFRDTVHIFITAHRPVDVPTSIRSIADHWFVFATSQEHDLKAIEARTSPNAAREVRKLRGRAFVHWDDTRAALAVNDNARAWRVDLRPPVPGGAKHVTPESSAVASGQALPLLTED